METSKSESSKSLTDAVSNEILDTTVDLTIEYAEMGIDDFLADGILKEIPIVKTIYSAGKLGFSIKERFFVKKLLVFLKELRMNKLSEEKLNDFKNQFDNDARHRTKVTEHLIVHIDSFLNVDKAKVFANLFRAFIDGKFTWDYFTQLSACLNDINPKAYEFLEQLSKYNFEIPEDRDERKLVRDGNSEALLYACGIAHQYSSWSSGFKVSPLGKDLYNYGLNDQA